AGVFQSVGLGVNADLGALARLLGALPRVVKRGGKAAIISFHSLEDRRVKQAFRNADVWEPLTKKPVEPADEEVARNPRARSAKLRVAVRKGEGIEKLRGIHGWTRSPSMSRSSRPRSPARSRRPPPSPSPNPSPSPRPRRPV